MALATTTQQASEYDIVHEVVRIAEENEVTIQEPFAGAAIGPFRLLAPSTNSGLPVLRPQFQNDE
jgi:hypothetical protein